MKTLHVVQMDMASDGQNADWSNIQAFDTQSSAAAHIEWMRGEYGGDIPLQIVMLEYYPEATKDVGQSWRLNPDRSGGQFTEDEINNHGRWI